MIPVQALHLQSLEGNPGILPVKEGQAFVQTDYWTIVKVINLDIINRDLNEISNDFDQMNNLIDWNKPEFKEFQSINIHTQFIRDITFEKYNQLVPRRIKRGLINPLGSLIKIVTGNLDHEDAMKYDKLITQLHNDQIITSKKLTLVSEMFDSFINKSETMIENSVNLDNRLKYVEIMLKHITANEKNILFSTYILGMFNVLISSFRTLFVRLSEIETALALSKVAILHQSILNSTELLYNLQTISNYASLVYPPNEMNLLNLEQTICVKSYIKKEQVVFILEIPLTDNCTYNYYKLYALPIFHKPQNKTLTIFPKYPHLLAKGSKYLPIQRPCRSLSAGDNFLCTADDQAVYPEPTCIERLMKFDGDLLYCTQHQIQLEHTKVQRVNPNSWILYTQSESTLTKQCGNEMSKQPIFGTFLITIDEPCDLEINGIWIRHHIYTEVDTVEPIPVITLPQLPPSENVSSTPALYMHGVDLDELKFMAYSLKHSEVIESVLDDQQDYKFSACLGFVSLSLVILSIIVLISYVLFKKNYRKNLKISCSDNFTLREGGVTVTPHPSALD